MLSGFTVAHPLTLRFPLMRSPWPVRRRLDDWSKSGLMQHLHWKRQAAASNGAKPLSAGDPS